MGSKKAQWQSLCSTVEKYGRRGKVLVQQVKVKNRRGVEQNAVNVARVDYTLYEEQFDD